MAVHLKFGGSTAARTMGCPAWQRLAADVPLTLDGGSNPAADEGTMLHNCMEEIVDSGAHAVINYESAAEDLLSEGREYHGQHLTIELFENKLLPAIEALETLIQTYHIHETLVEPFVKIDVDIGGSIDYLGVSADGKTLVVLDYKFGFVPVDVEENEQLLFYALAAATDPNTMHWFDAVERVVLAVIQPNNNGSDLQTWHIDMATVDQFETDYLNAVDLSEDPQSMPKAGSWCTYCPALATCPVKTGAALKATRITELTADKLAEYLPMAAEVEAWAKAVKKMAHEQLELGTAIRGYKLVNKRATRVWNDVTGVEKKVRNAKKIKLEEGFDLKLKSPAQMEKLCKEKSVDFDTYSQYISSVSTGTTLAKESDKRPAAIPVQGLAQLNAMND